MILRTLSIALLITLLALPGYAADWKLREDQINTVKESSKALEESNPDMAKSLEKYAEKAEEVRDISVKNYQKEKEERDQHIKQLRDAAEALKDSNPELSEKLKNIAQEKEQWWQKHMEQGGDEDEG